MKIAYSDRLRSNIVVLEVDEYPTVDEVLHTAKLHTAIRSCCGGRVKVCLARELPDGTRGTEQFVSSRRLPRWVK